MSKQHESELEEAPTVEIRDDLSIKINKYI